MNCGILGMILDRIWSILQFELLLMLCTWCVHYDDGHDCQHAIIACVGSEEQDSREQSPPRGQQLPSEQCLCGIELSHKRVGGLSCAAEEDQRTDQR